MIVAVVLLLLLGQGGTVNPPGPAKSGARVGVLIREQLEQTPAMSAMIFDLRDGVAAKWLATKKHQLVILDKDDKGPDGQKHPILQRLSADIAGKPLPLLAICDQPKPGEMGKTIAVQSLDAAATADNVTEIFTRHGG